VPDIRVRRRRPEWAADLCQPCDTTAKLFEGSFDRAGTTTPKLQEEVAMSNVEQFQKAVSDPGAAPSVWSFRPLAA
jgi:hypothetical protein